MAPAPDGHQALGAVLDALRGEESGVGWNQGVRISADLKVSFRLASSRDFSIRSYPLTTSPSIATLYAEELKATMRGRFAWLGAAVILLAVGGLATVGTQDTWLDGYGIIAYGLVPLAFIPIAAVAASPRVNRFVESVFTAPVDRRSWLAAKVLVLATLAAAYYIALVPMMLVYKAHVGIPPLLHKLLWWTPGLLIASIAAGTLIGVLFIGRSLAAPVGAGMGVLLTFAFLMPLQELMVARGNGATRTGHVTLSAQRCC